MMLTLLSERQVPPMASDNTPEESPPLRVGIVGWGWMGQVHARAYARLRQHYPEAPLRPTLVAVADNAPDDRLTNAIDTFGFGEAHADWHDLIARDDIEVVSVTGPNFVHRDVAIAAAEAGKHVWVEKPAGVTLRRRERSAMPYGPTTCNPRLDSTTATYRPSRWQSS